MNEHLHHRGCGCLQALSRRGVMGLGLGLGAAAVAAASPVLAADDAAYEAMLMKCIDPRFTTFTWSFMASHGLQNNYSQFNIAGGPIAAVAPAFADWRKAWWDNLDISVKLHSIKGVVGIVHRDCGAAAVAYGDRIKTDQAFETAKLTEALRAFRTEVGQRYPGLRIDIGIMGLNGAVTAVT
jgi:hypothetical protein